jgi:hypothetical protein
MNDKRAGGLRVPRDGHWGNLHREVSDQDFFVQPKYTGVPAKVADGEDGLRKGRGIHLFKCAEGSTG